MPLITISRNLAPLGKLSWKVAALNRLFRVLPHFICGHPGYQELSTQQAKIHVGAQVNRQRGLSIEEVSDCTFHNAKRAIGSLALESTWLSASRRQWPFVYQNKSQPNSLFVIFQRLPQERTKLIGLQAREKGDVSGEKAVIFQRLPQERTKLIG
jgi:hypothetical protein